jgi:hypothetical protein
MQRWVVSAVIVVVACALFIGLHPISPARTFDAYEHKAKDTAESVLSSVQTARLAARLASRGDLFGPYTSVVLSESEKGIGAAQSVFESVQPPDRHSDRLRAELGKLLSEASDIVSELRIDARRGDLGALADEARPLDALSRDINVFIGAHD